MCVLYHCSESEGSRGMEKAISRVESIVEGWEQFSIELLLAVFLLLPFIFHFFYIHSLSYYCRKETVRSGEANWKKRWDEMMENNDRKGDEQRDGRKAKFSINFKDAEDWKPFSKCDQNHWNCRTDNKTEQKQWRVDVIIIILIFVATAACLVGEQFRAEKSNMLSARWFIALNYEGAKQGTHSHFEH